MQYWVVLNPDRVYHEMFLRLFCSQRSRFLCMCCAVAPAESWPPCRCCSKPAPRTLGWPSTWSDNIAIGFIDSQLLVRCRMGAFLCSFPLKLGTRRCAENFCPTAQNYKWSIERRFVNLSHLYFWSYGFMCRRLETQRCILRVERRTSTSSSCSWNLAPTLIPKTWAVGWDRFIQLVCLSSSERWSHPTACECVGGRWRSCQVPAPK